MEYRIRESSHGGWYVEGGYDHKGGVQIGFVGVTMPAFLVCEAEYFETKKAAERYYLKITNK